MLIQTEQLKSLLAGYAKVSEEESSAFVDALAEVIAEQLKKGEEVTVSGLGVFCFVESQQGRRVAFRAEEKLKQAVNAPFSFFEPMVIGAPMKEEPVVEPEPMLEPELVAEPALIEESEVREESEEQVVELEPEEEPEIQTEEVMPEVETEDVPDEIVPEEVFPEDDSESSETEPVELPFHSIPDDVPGRPMSLFVILTIVIAAVLIVVGGFFFLTKEESYTVNEEPAPVVRFQAARPVAAPTEEEPQAEPKEDLQVVTEEGSQAESVEEPKAESVEEPKESTPASPVKVRPERPSVDQIMLAEDGTPRVEQLGNGDRLTLLSERIYGDKNFWGYIYEVNAFQLNSPNVVPCHLKLYLPNPQYYKIDASDSLSIRRGKQKQHDILKELK